MSKVLTSVVYSDSKRVSMCGQGLGCPQSWSHEPGDLLGGSLAAVSVRGEQQESAWRYTCSFALHVAMRGVCRRSCVATICASRQLPEFVHLWLYVLPALPVR